MIASGLTFLETIANPYTTVLGRKRYAATRINLAQSCNGVGWIFGPIIGGLFFYSKDAAGQSTGSQTLYIPYARVGVVVVVLAVVFYFANVPDIKPKDEYHLDEKDAPAGEPALPTGRCTGGWSISLLLLNAAVLMGACGMIVLGDSGLAGPGRADGMAGRSASGAPPRCSSPPRSWCRSPGRSRIRASGRIRTSPGPSLAQFFYVAAPGRHFQLLHQLHDRGGPGPSRRPGPPAGCTAGSRRKGGVLASATRAPPAWPRSASSASWRAAFPAPRILKKFSAHKVLGLYGLINVAVCLLVFFKLGWLSVVCVFLSYFFMSIMFPTIFALGIFGLGARAKRASSFIVMAIMGGAILPKLMGYVADKYDMSRGFIVPLVCFALVALYACCWPALSQNQGLVGASAIEEH